MASRLDRMIAQARACDLCAAHLPLGPRPVLRLSASIRLLLISQAPGTHVHHSGLPFDDASGDRLRAWMGLTPEQFYDFRQIGFLPTGLCYPGRLPRGGDRPPRPECAPLWQPRLLPLLPNVRLTLLIGSHAINGRLGPGPMTERVRNFAQTLPDCFPLPHPSWRTTAWQRRHPWFDAEVLPALRGELARVLGGGKDALS
jgi:uracil-DNA glycosylase